MYGFIDYRDFYGKSMWSEAVLQILNDLNSLFFSHYINNFRHNMYIKNFKNMQTLFYVKLFEFAEWVFCLTCSPKLNRKENNVKGILLRVRLLNIRLDIIPHSNARYLRQNIFFVYFLQKHVVSHLSQNWQIWCCHLLV